MERIIMKIGGSITTYRDKYCETNYDNLERICREIAQAKMLKEIELIILIGAGSYGHQIANEYNLHKGFQYENQLYGLRIMTSKMWENANIVADVFKKYGVPTYCVHTPSYLISDNGVIEELFFKPIDYCISLGMIPLLWGEINFDKTMKFTNVSGDIIAVYLTKYFKADRILMFSDVNGVMENFGSINQKVISTIDRTNYLDALQEICHPNKIDINGGMKIKLESMSKLIDSGVVGFIGNGNKEELIFDALMGKEVEGTYIY